MARKVKIHPSRNSLLAAAFRDAVAHSNGAAGEIAARYRELLARMGGDKDSVYREVEYLELYPDVLSAVIAGSFSCGYQHFVEFGIFEGRAPCFEWARQMQAAVPSRPPPHLDVEEYAVRFPVVSQFMAEFDSVSISDFARIYGTVMGHFAPGRRPLLDQARTSLSRIQRLDLLRSGLDEEFYREKYMPPDFSGSPFEHYISVGSRSQYDPNKNFDESFYRVMYPDVAAAIDRGEIVCGFEHYLVAGESEARVPRFEMARCLEAFMPGVTKPAAIDMLQSIEMKFAPCRFVVSDIPRDGVLWIVLPFLNPDLVFGGFASIFEFVRQASSMGVRLGFFLREGNRSQIAYFRYRCTGSRREIADLIQSSMIFCPGDGGEFEFSENDLFLSYSVWDGLWARRFAECTKWKRAIYWIQEYEPIFHRHDSLHFLGNSAYCYDHVGVFNSHVLYKYFRSNQIGVYGEKGGRRAKSLSFEHLLWSPGRARGGLRSGRRRLFLLYARPEDHAARNLFEIAVYCLRRAVSMGLFIGGWRFLGIGALAGPYRVDLGDGSVLEVENRIDAEEYAQLIGTVDVAMSLMYAPHPSLFPYELARAGAIVVTNRFPGRGEDYISSRSKNVVSFEPCIEDCVRAIGEAVSMVSAGGGVEEEEDQQYLDTRGGGWERVFDARFFRRLEKSIGEGFSWKEVGV